MEYAYIITALRETVWKMPKNPPQISMSKSRFRVENLVNQELLSNRTLFQTKLILIR